MCKICGNSVCSEGNYWDVIHNDNNDNNETENKEQENDEDYDGTEQTGADD